MTVQLYGVLVLMEHMHHLTTRILLVTMTDGYN